MNRKMEYQMISVDGHLEHSPAAWISYVPEQYRHHIEQKPGKDWGVTAGSADTEGGVTDLWLNVRAGCRPMDIKSEKCMEDAKPVGASGDYKQRLEEMDIDGCDASVLFIGANTAGHIPPIKRVDKEAYLAVIRAFNNWMSDFCAPCPERLLGAAVIPSSSIEDAIAELRRVAKLPGIRSICNLGWPSGQGGATPEDDRFWAATLELGIPVSIHGMITLPYWGKGVPQFTKHEFALFNLGRLESSAGGPMVAAELVMSGVFDRFPELRFCIAECGAGWVPYFANQMDNQYAIHRHWGGFSLKRTPSHYILGGHFLWNVINDYAGIRYRHDIGVENIVFSTDFPHCVSAWPKSQLHIEQMFYGVPKCEREQILWKNAAKFYNLL